MATTYSTQYNNIRNRATAGIQNGTQEFAGKIRTAYFSKTAESEGTASTIFLTKLPSGARVVGIDWCSEDLSAGAATIEIGDASDTDRLVSAFDVGTAAIAAGPRVLRTPDTETSQTIGFGYKYTAETDIIATTAVAALNTARFWGVIQYVVD